VRPCRSSPREQLRPFLRHGNIPRQLGEAELHVVERELAGGPVVEMLDRLRRLLRLLAAHGEARAAPRDRHVERRLDLPQVLVQRAAQPREARVVDRIEAHLDRLTAHRALRAASAPRSR
jgi:hypothetical protein